MANISINIVHPTIGETVPISIDDTWTVQKVIGELIAGNFVPFSVEGYDLAIKGGVALDNNKTLADIGVKENDTIKVIPVSPTYRECRLINDFYEMGNISGDVIECKAIYGTPPVVEEYELTINIKSIIGEDSRYRNKHIVKVVLSKLYPLTAPDIRMVTIPCVFHPSWNIHPYDVYGIWNSGKWRRDEGLGNHIIRMIKTLQYDIDITNEYNHANTIANSFYLDNRSSGLFPCDKTSLPKPSHRLLHLKEKKFIINN